MTAGPPTATSFTGLLIVTVSGYDPAPIESVAPYQAAARAPPTVLNGVPSDPSPPARHSSWILQEAQLGEGGGFETQRGKLQQYNGFKILQQ